MTLNFTSLITAFNVFSILGIVLTLVTLAPVLCSRVRRRRAWVNLMVLWFICPMSYVLLLGRQAGQKPPFGLCLLQATLIYASPPSCAFAVVCFVIDFYIQWRTIVTGRQAPALVVNIVAVVPFIVLVVEFCAVLLLVRDPATVRREEAGFFCSISDAFAIRVCVFSILGASIILFPLEIWTGVMLYRHWNIFRRLSPETRHFSLSMYVRMILFSVSNGLGLGLGIFFMPHLTSSAADPRWNVLLPLPSIFAALAFGMQRDILATYALCKGLSCAHQRAMVWVDHLELEEGFMHTIPSTSQLG